MSNKIILPNDKEIDLDILEKVPERLKALEDKKDKTSHNYITEYFMVDRGGSSRSRSWVKVYTHKLKGKPNGYYKIDILTMLRTDRNTQWNLLGWVMNVDDKNNHTTVTPNFYWGNKDKQIGNTALTYAGQFNNSGESVLTFHIKSYAGQEVMWGTRSQWNSTNNRHGISISVIKEI